MAVQYVAQVLDKREASAFLRGCPGFRQKGGPLQYSFMSPPGHRAGSYNCPVGFAEQPLGRLTRPVGRAVQEGAIAVGLLDEERAWRVIPGHQLAIEQIISPSRGRGAIFLGATAEP
jgi:hypothetical protein